MSASIPRWDDGIRIFEVWKMGQRIGLYLTFKASSHIQICMTALDLWNNAFKGLFPAQLKWFTNNAQVSLLWHACDHEQFLVYLTSDQHIYCNFKRNISVVSMSHLPPTSYTGCFSPHGRCSPPQYYLPWSKFRALVECEHIPLFTSTQTRWLSILQYLLCRRKVTMWADLSQPKRNSFTSDHGSLNTWKVYLQTCRQHIKFLTPVSWQSNLFHHLPGDSSHHNLSGVSTIMLLHLMGGLEVWDSFEKLSWIDFLRFLAISCLAGRQGSFRSIFDCRTTSSSSSRRMMDDPS